jgi:KDO2-lipid IV(A) lauroyltransferase
MLATLRRFADLGARHGPKWWLRASPGPIGALAWALAGARREVVSERLGWVLGRAPSAREVRSTFVNFAHCLAESLGALGHPSVVRVVAPESVSRAMAGPSGVILMTAHTGAWELVAQEFRRRFERDVVLLMRAESNAGARAVHERLRRESGVRAVYAGDDPFVALVLREQLARGGVVCFQLDRPAISGRAVATQLFGRPWSIPEGPLRLSRATGAPIVSAFASREGFLEHRLELHPPLTLSPDCSAERVQEVAQELVSRFEQFVSRHPSQWFHFDLSDEPPQIQGSPSGAR